MPYLSPALLTARVGGAEVYVQLTDDDGDQQADTGVETFLLTQVDEIVNGYARRGGYTTPLAVGDVASILPYLLDIANYKAKTRGNREATDDDRALYRDAIAFLEKLGNGDVKLPSFESAAQLTRFEVTSYDQVFTPDTLRDFS